MCIYVAFPYINTDFLISLIFLFLTISPVYIIYLINSVNTQQQQQQQQQQTTPMSTENTTIDLSTSPSRKNFEQRRAIINISPVPYKFKQSNSDESHMNSRIGRDKPPRPPPPPRPVLRPSKSLGSPGMVIRPTISPRQFTIVPKASSPQLTKKSSPIPSLPNVPDFEDSFDNIDTADFSSVPVNRTKAMVNTEQSTIGYTHNEDEFSIGKALKRLSDKPFSTLRGSLFKRETSINLNANPVNTLTSPNNIRKSGAGPHETPIDSNPADKNTAVFLEHAVIVQQDNSDVTPVTEPIAEVMTPERKIHNTSELPPKIESFTGITDTKLLIIHEIYTTEYTYVSQLELLVDIYKRPMEVQLDELEIQQIFCNVETILNFSREVLTLFYERLESWDKNTSCIGDIFTAKFNQFASSLYTVYCSSYDNCENYIMNKLKRKKEFEILMGTCLADPRGSKGMTITYYLITPVQRIPRYLMLLKDLLKLTDKSHIDYQNILEANERISRIADYVNSQILEAQSQKAMRALKTEIQGLADLEKDGRVIIKEGPVFLMRIRKEYQCILFNDYFVLAYKSDNRSIIDLKLPLEILWVEDLQDLDPQTNSEDAIEIYTPDRPYTIYTKTNSEKKLWLNKLFSTIKTHIAKRNGVKEIPKNLDEIDILRRDALFVYSNGDVYNGMFCDAKRHGHGETVWSDKTSYVGEWCEDERSGEGEIRYNTGEVFTGNWRNDKQDGIGKLDYVNGDVLRGNWKSGYRNGPATISFGNGDKFEGTFSRDEIEGDGRFISVTGMHFVGQYKKSQRCGHGTLCTTNGDYFDGEFRKNIFNGDGTMLYKNGSKYTGQWKNGQRSGSGEMLTSEGDVFKGHWLEDRKEGHGTMKYANGDYYEGMWSLDKQNGNGRMEFINGDYYEGEYKHNFRHGKGLMKFHTGSKYDGYFEYNMRSGEGIMIFEDGKTYVGEWKFDMREGKGQIVSLHGMKYDGEWKNDKPHGTGNMKSSKLTFEYRGNWVNGKREGIGIETGPKGKYNGAWKNGMRNGRGIETSLVGTTFEGHWTYDKKTGSVERKLPSGLKESQKWRDGLIINTKNWLVPPDIPNFPVFDF